MTDKTDEEILLGAAPELDQTFDFTIDGDGDLTAARGSEELQKDLAFNAAFFLDPLVGQPLTSELRSDIIDTVIDVAESDERVRGVFRDSIVVEQTPRGSIRVSMSVDTISSVEDLVIDV
jgi:hypothetical protein